MIGSVGDGSNHDAATEGGLDSVMKDSRNSQIHGDTKKKTVSLLPTGDEMLVDESQEFLDEPIPIPKPVDMENGKQAVSFEELTVLSTWQI